MTAAENTKWPPERVMNLRRLAGKGMTAGNIAKAMGTSRNSIAGKCSREGIRLGADGDRFWNDERRSSLERMWADRVPTREIAKHFDTTPNAIEQQACRLKLPRRSPRGRKPTDQTAQDRPMTKRPVGLHRDGTRVASVPIEEVTVRLSRASGPGEGVGMADIGRGQCRWPLWGDNEKPTFRCCGGKTQPGDVYCAEHRKAAGPVGYTWTPSREAKLARLLAKGEKDPARLAVELKAPVSTITTHAAFLEARDRRGPRSIAWGQM